MSNISYVVVSTPRSGTGWCHKALSAMGLVCGHETHFAYWLQRHGDPARKGVWGDSSWMAAPFLGDLPEGTVVTHLVRDPLKTVASMVSLGHFDDWAPGPNRYREFMRSHMPGGMPKQATPIERAAWFWAAWHRMIDLLSTSNPGIALFPPKPARIEDASAWTPALYSMVTGKTPTVELCDAAMAVGREYNTGRGEKPRVEWGMLPQTAIELARSYGYGP